MDYGFFDGLIDAVFVIKEDRGVVYCNEAAARLCESSVKRLARGKPIYEVIEFSDATLFAMPSGTSGKAESTPYAELEYKLKTGKTGKVQVAIQPFTEPSGESRWVIIIRDVTIEEVLHGKHLKQLEQLEAYSKNLEQMVEVRTVQLSKANVMLNAIMNSLGQGFLVFDKDGICSNFYTKICEEILEAEPANKKIWDILKINGTDLGTFHMWMTAVWGEQLPFEAIKELGPSLYSHSEGRYIKLDFFPLRGDDKKIDRVVMVATDQTSEHLANKALENEKKYAKMVIKLVTSKKQFGQFLESAKTIIADVKKKVMTEVNQLDYEYIFRLLHTLEGEAATYSVTEIWAAARVSQEIIEPVKRGHIYELQEVRAQLLKSLDDLRAVYDQFLITNQEIFAMIGMGQTDKIEIDVATVNSILENLVIKGASVLMREEIADALLREPIGTALKHYQDVVNLVAESLGRKMNPLVFEGAEKRIYLNRYHDLFSSLIHAFRNAVDHGIESSEEREMKGKPAAGTIKVSVEGFKKDLTEWLRIRIKDDGRGISAEAIRDKLSTVMPKDKILALTDFDIIQRVFDSGLSTKGEVEEFSGRGIGLNVVKTEAKRIGGRAWVETKVGEGTTLFVEVPDLARVAKAAQVA